MPVRVHSACQWRSSVGGSYRLPGLVTLSFPFLQARSSKLADREIKTPPDLLGALNPIRHGARLGAPMARTDSPQGGAGASVASGATWPLSASIHAARANGLGSWRDDFGAQAHAGERSQGQARFASNPLLGYCLNN